MEDESFLVLRCLIKASADNWPVSFLAELSELSTALLEDLAPRLSSHQAEALDTALQHNKSSQITDLTSPATRRKQGGRLVEAAERAYLSVDQCCGPLPPKAVLQQAMKCLKAAKRAAAKKVEAMPPSKRKPETKPQLLLSEWSSRLHNAKWVFFQTHRTASKIGLEFRRSCKTLFISPIWSK